LRPSVVLPSRTAMGAWAADAQRAGLAVGLALHPLVHREEDRIFGA